MFEQLHSLAAGRRCEADEVRPLQEAEQEATVTAEDHIFTRSGRCLHASQHCLDMHK